VVCNARQKAASKLLENLHSRQRLLNTKAPPLILWLCCAVLCFVLCAPAVKGSNYCASAARAVSLIVSNALRLVAVNIVGDTLLFLGKLGVAACCGVVAFAISNLEYYHNPDKYPSTYLSSAILPIALAVLTGYIVAQVSPSRMVYACADLYCALLCCWPWMC
jgi:hypothetical protein